MFLIKMRQTETVFLTGFLFSRLEVCCLGEKSCADLASVLKSENSKLIELNLSQNRGLKDSGVKILCEGLKDKNCKLQKLWLEDCRLTEESCEHLAKVLRSANSKLIELNLSDNIQLKDLGVKELFEGLKNTVHCKLKILRLDFCNLTEESCADLASVLKSENSKLTELHLSRNTGLKDSGVKNLCDGLKDKNCKLKTLSLEYCGLTEESCADLASVLQSENSKLVELNLSKNRLQDSGVKSLCDRLKNKQCKLEILRLDFCYLTEESCADLASVLKSEKSKLTELHLSKNKGLKDSGVKNLCDGLKDKNCKLKILRLEDCDLGDGSCADLASVLSSENSLMELNLSKNKLLKDSGLFFLCGGLINKDCKLEKLRLAECHVTDEGFSSLASTLIQTPSSLLKELDLRFNSLRVSEQSLFSELKDTFPDLNVII
uniref:Uncharacterized protein n=1 Tax=Astyanax mexicanus TaxID=7994 RepID=A0A8B9GT65_ASTMX